MPTSEAQTSEVLNLLADFDKDNLALDTERARVNQLISTTVQQTKALPRPPTALQAATLQQEAAERQASQQAIQQQASQVIRQEVDKLGLNGDREQEYQARRSGELGAVLNQVLQENVTKAFERIPEGEDVSTNREYQLALEAQRQATENEQVFFLKEQGIEPGQPLPSSQFTPEQVAELRKDKGLIGIARNVVGGAAGGLVGLAGVAASALGAENLGQDLAGAGQSIQEAIGTQDLAGRAAELEFSDIVAKAQSGEIPLPEAMLAAGRLAATDIDAFTNLAETVGSAALGGGALGPLARGAGAVARGAGAVGNAAARTGAAIAPRGTGASFVGIGQGVDENLTSDQARVLAGTGVVAGQLARFGSAENLLGNAARRLTPGLTAPAARAGTGGVTRSAVGGAARTGATETAQEFVEGTGEGLGQAAQREGSFTGAFTPENIETAAIGGAVAAPLGAVAGGAIGGTAGAFQGRANNQRVAGEARAEQTAQVAEQARVDQNQEALDNTLPNRNTLRSSFAEFGARLQDAESRITADQQALDQELTERGPVQEFGLDVPLDQVGTRAPRTANLGTVFPSLVTDPESSLEDQAAATQETVEAIQSFKALDTEAQEVRLRALFRSSFGGNLETENDFVNAFNNQDSNTARSFITAIESAVGSALNTEVESNPSLETGSLNVNSEPDVSLGDGVAPPAQPSADPAPEAPVDPAPDVREQARATAQESLNQSVNNTPRASAQARAPTVFGTEDIGPDGRLRAPADLNIDPNEIDAQQAPSVARIENTILADGQAATAISRSESQPTAEFFYRQLRDSEPQARTDALEALAISSGATPEAAVTFAQEVGTPSGTVAQFQSRTRNALNRALGDSTVEQTADEAVDSALPGDTDNTSGIQPDEIFETAEDGEIFITPAALDPTNGQIGRALADTEVSPLSSARNAQESLQAMLDTIAASDTEAVTEGQSRRILQALRQYEQATGKKL